MGRSIEKMSARKVDTLSIPGRHSDGKGLYLVVNPSGGKQWAFMWSRAGKRREMGLGGYPGVTLAMARKRAQAARELVADGLDPIRERKKALTKTFGEVADHLVDKLAEGWSHPKHRSQWDRTVRHYCKPLRNLPVNAVDTSDVLKVLNPIWSSKAETARRNRARIERILDYASAHGWREGSNPARWKGHLKDILPNKDPAKSGHFAAMPYEDLPDFIQRLQAKDTIPSKALEFTILTAARTSEALEAVWSEIDFENALWTLPAERMKAGIAHIVPLSARAVDILKPLYAARQSDFIFPGQKRDKPCSNMVMAMTMRRMDETDTVHGFRSTFRDYCGDRTSFPREVAEAALSHKVGNAVEQAYRRRDALDKRRALMNMWADYCGGIKSGDVVRLRGLKY